MNGYDFAGLCAEPPLKKDRLTLDDGREVVLYELPIGVVAEIQTIASDEMAEKAISLTIARIAAQSLLGRPPTDEELQQLSDTFGASQVMRIYYEALHLSALSNDAVDKEKKD